MERDTVSKVSEPTASSSQNSLTGALVASSSQNSLTGTGVASSSQNSMTSCGSDPTTTGGETEGILGSDLTCGEAAGSAENSEAGKISLVCLAFLWKESNSMRNSGRIWLQN